MPSNPKTPGADSTAKPARPTIAEPTRATQAGTEPARGGKRGSSEGDAPEPVDHAGKTGTELARDEQRDGGPRYGGAEWKLAAERGDRRFGHARNDDADLSELAPGAADNDDDESPSAADPELAAAEQAGEIESGGDHAGMGRGEAPRKPKSREK
jgi:hypothetical protein